ncbi:MAG TPA: PqqD family protein [Syntrophales bacterium]|nr:PqqD family protein [Syntrophales bacterium]HQB31494.1 PqqD family protein [Syntrophales bacterium]HQN79095.1 PqqD family protein [Syntrophales bacterium]HQQ28288.1 PqqD family protein [Syntrophales bacterium]
MDPWDRVFRKSGKVAWRMVDDDGVLLNLTTGYYYTLNEVGRFFWESLDGRKKLSEIHGDLLEQYDVDGGEARRDLLELVEDLRKEGLVEADE